MRSLLGPKAAAAVVSKCDDSIEKGLQHAVSCGLSQRIARAISGIRGGKPDDVSVVVARVA